MVNQPRGKYFFYLLWGVVTVVCLAIFWPFFSVIAIGAALAVVFYPIFNWWQSKFGRKFNWLSALLTLLLFIIILGGPLYLIGAKVLTEAQDVHLYPYIDTLSTWLQAHLPDAINLDWQSYLGNITSFMAGAVTTIFSSTLSTIFSLLLILLSLFYFLKDGEAWRQRLITLSPLSDESDEKILDRLARAVNGVMKGYLLIALIQGLLLGIGLAIFNVPQPAFWGVIAGIASMIPSIGTAIVSVPAIIYLFATGATGSAIGLLIWSAVLVGMIDNVLNPIVMGKNIALPPVVILFAVLGGISLLGATGVIIGPLAASLFYTLTTLYQENYGRQRGE